MSVNQNTYSVLSPNINSTYDHTAHDASFNRIETNINTDNGWDNSIEEYMSERADEAQIKAVLHKKCHHYYKFFCLLIQLPIIILSTISGGGNFISSSYKQQQDTIIIATGCISLFIAVLSSISRYLDFDKIVEGHRLSYNSWNKLYTDIKSQLGLSKNLRLNAKEFGKYVKTEYNKLNDISPIIIEKFHKELYCSLNKKTSNIVIPYYMNNIRHVMSYKYNNNEPINNNIISRNRHHTSYTDLNNVIPSNILLSQNIETADNNSHSSNSA